MRLPLALGAVVPALRVSSSAALADEPTPIARGPHVSGVVQKMAHQPGAPPSAVLSTCATPGATNWKANCHGTGRPVNETWIAPNPAGGDVDLLRRNPSSGAWTYFQIAGNSRKQFQDKPAIALSGSNVLVSWTQFGSCSGVNVASPIKVAIFPQGASSVPPTTILSVPGSTNSQGSSIQGDGSGGFWIAWEEYPSPSATIGSIKLVHYSGGSQFFPAITADGSGGVFVSYSQINAGTSSYDQWLAHVTGTGTTTTKVSTASSFPNNDSFFGGQFIGDYSGMTATAGTAHPIWTDIRGPDPNYPGYEMDAFVYSP